MAADRPVAPEWLLERFRANPIPPLTPEQLAAARRATLRFYGMDDKPDAWWFA